MKNLLSLLSFAGLVSLLAIFTTPIYAQDAKVSNSEDVIYESDDINVEDEFNYGVDEDGNALESIDNEITTEWVADEIMADVDDSINDVIWFLNDDTEEIKDKDINPLSFQFQIGDREINITPSFFLWWIWLSILLVLIAWLILCHISLWKIFWRAWEWRWKSLIPIYNIYIIFKIAGIKNRFWYIILVALIAGIVSAIFPVTKVFLDKFSTTFSSTVVLIVWFLLTKKFGREDNASILYTIFSVIWILVLWLGNYKYQWTDKIESGTTIEA